MDDDDDDDEQLIVLEDDGPDLDDDPGRYAEDAMPDDFFNQFMKHKIPAKNSVNEEERPVPLRSKANNSPKEQTGHDDISTTPLELHDWKDVSEANETIRKVEEALRAFRLAFETRFLLQTESVLERTDWFSETFKV